jgi:pyruvate dehydrogenase E2 component (dihydrolipoamide acetyltransferase)
MAIDVPMPKLGLTMEEATILEWLVDDGAAVEVDQPIMLIETDKTETEVGAPGAGRLHQMGQPGDVFTCGTRVAVLLGEGEQPPTAAPALAAPAQAVVAAPARPAAATIAASEAKINVTADPSGRTFASPNARRVAGERSVALASVRGTGPGGRIVSEDVESAPAIATGTDGHRSIATAAARNLADLLGIDLAAVPVDPIERRITRDGVALYVRNRLATPQVVAEAPMPLLQDPTKVIRMSGMRGTIARRMQASLREMAQLTLTMDADMTAVLADRSGRRQRAESTPSITDYVVAATARSLVRHPYVNAQVTADGIAVLPEVHVGLAVAVDGGLLVPVIRDTAHRDLADLATETTRLAETARAGALVPADLEGGTFSVSALGAYGVDTFTPVINPPNAGILGVGRLRDDVVLVDGQVSTVKRLTLSLTWDHRVFDGAPAAEFCRTIVELLADPQQLN